jgi:Sulfotransferase family
MTPNAGQEQIVASEGAAVRTHPARALMDVGAGEEGVIAPAADPVFILATSYSYTSVVCAMLGQHPQLYGFPELHLFGAATVGEWWTWCKRARWRSHGVLRAVAQLYFGGQTEDTIVRARAWLMRRSHLGTGLLLEHLGHRVWPRIPVEKSPSITKTVERLQRADQMFPNARYLHLVRHPSTQGGSALRYSAERQRRRGDVHPTWLKPPDGWYAANSNICEFLGGLDPNRSVRVRGEDVLATPDRAVRSVAEWLGIRTDEAAIEAMKHPERSAYACMGPRGAVFGFNRDFLRNPAFRASPTASPRLDDPPDWLPEGLPRWVKKMARDFGYE